ncbi:hypothetical protein CTAYLR_009259 [Chrysophaeum taylorii]|uniref:Uncharacterized protein n=1 Tax=Chrysophaeum taylorii TaxID=2483200 RepID=A0AAD7U665_9STRA|nr:hypothetical protein CTAYLR_009259 [Chrysophaeum taylorii]
MRAVDLRCPWGRPGEDCLQRKREIKARNLHHKRLSEVRAVVDCSEPTTANMAHLAIRARKRQDAEDRRYKIANENRLLMEKMTKIMDGPNNNLVKSSSTASVLSRDKIGINDPVRRRQTKRIKAENRVFARRLRDLAPYYERRQMDRDHEQQRRYLQNISRSRSLELRVQSQHPPRGSTAPRAENNSQNYEEEHPTATSTNIVVRTAKQVRQDVAKERNCELPWMFNSPFSIINDRLPLTLASSPAM